MSQTIEMIDPVTGEIIDQQQIAEQLLSQAKEQGVSLVEPGAVEIDVPRDRDGSFPPKIVRKRQRRLGGIDEIVLSLTARGLTTW